MSFAEKLFTESHTQYHAYESVHIDTVFVISIMIIHINYALKFTSFSLSYLKAKCEEKASQIEWSQSKLYLHAENCSKAHYQMKVGDDEKPMFCRFWTDIFIIRMTVKILMLLGCVVFLILCLSFVTNILYEYFVYSVMHYAQGSFLALIILPYIYFIGVAFVRFCLFALSASWSIIVDNIADRISFQHSLITTRQYAHNPNSFINVEFSGIVDPQISKSVSKSGLAPNQSRAFYNKSIWRDFNRDYFMAHRWRLSIIFCSAIATFFAALFGSMSKEVNLDTRWIQLFLRYILLAMTLWMFFYLFLAFISGIYGTISTLSVFNRILNNGDQDEDDNTHSTTSTFKRIFCLFDTFMIYDENIRWKRYKIVVYSLFCLSGACCIIIGFALNNGLLRFVGIIMISYYITQILLICKIRGIHCLWNADMIALELKKELCNDEAQEMFQSQRHAARMACVGLTDHDLEELSTINRYEPAQLQVNEEQELKESEDPHHLESEQDILLLYASTHTQLYNERRSIYNRKLGLIWYKQIKIDFELLLNYFSIIFKLYKIYWFLILPYYYHIRPLSFVWSGKSISERIIRYKYRSFGETVKTVCGYIWFWIRGCMCCAVFLLILIAIIYLNVKLHNDDASASIELYETNDFYPICGTRWNDELTVIDLASLADIAYGYSEENDIMHMQQIICLYFDNTYNTTNCSWQILHIGQPMAHSAAFMHLRHETSDTEIISIRGTETTQELLQDLSLFNQIMLLQAASWIVPITTILPQFFIIRLIHYASLLHGTIDTQIRQRFDEPLFEYSYNHLLHTNDTISALYFVGHSLGGAVSQIVAAQLHHAQHHAYEPNKFSDHEVQIPQIQSISFSSPGLVWGSRKFSIDVDDLYETATLIKSRHDLIASVDQYGGLTQIIQCKKQLAFKCHQISSTICQLSDKCNVYNSHNPKLIQAVCETENQFSGSYSFLISSLKYANYSV